MGGGGDGEDRVGGVAGPQEIRHADRTTEVAVGTLACPACDAPVSPGPGSLRPAQALGCPFCGHAARVRDFLSLATPGHPARPARVVVRVVHGLPLVARAARPRPDR